MYCDLGFVSILEGEFLPRINTNFGTETTEIMETTEHTENTETTEIMEAMKNEMAGGVHLEARGGATRREIQVGRTWGCG